MEILSNTIFCLRADGRQESVWPGSSGQTDFPEGKDETKDDIDPTEAIYCGVCGGVVTSRDHKIPVQGAHNHTFFNPAGIVFELGCFKAAPGCFRAGQATSEFTWFAGYVWRFALCRQCKSHLGWFFEMADHSFFGLILANLKE